MREAGFTLATLGLVLALAPFVMPVALVAFVAGVALAKLMFKFATCSMFTVAITFTRFARGMGAAGFVRVAFTMVAMLAVDVGGTGLPLGIGGVARVADTVIVASTLFVPFILCDLSLASVVFLACLPLSEHMIINMESLNIDY